MAIKAFISYSWTTPAHKEWVRELATRLRQDGIDAILDDWDLKPGHDAYKFMEQMVADLEVTKVILICDKKYSEKADARSGGVGAEGQIISPELYRNSVQDKFAAVITELDDAGKPYVPIFYRGRIHFDFSDAEHVENQYEELLRWLLNNPQLVKPNLGEVPRHIVDVNYQAPPTDSKFRRADNAIRSGALQAQGFLREFLDALVDEFGKLRIEKKSGVELDELVIGSIELARPLVQQALKITNSIARFSREDRHLDELLRCFERLSAFQFRPPTMFQWSELDFDNFKYLCNEIFLGSFAVLLQEERFDLAERMVMRRYYIPNSGNAENATQGYDVFNEPVESLEMRKRRLNLNRISLRADLLKKTYENNVPTFDQLMQADFVLYFRDAVNSIKNKMGRSWHPFTLVFAERQHRPFEIFARAESRAYFGTISKLLDTGSVEHFRATVAIISADRNLLPHVSTMFPISIGTLLNLAQIGRAD